MYMMKTDSLKNYIFIALVLLLMAYPVYGSFFDDNLSGFTESLIQTDISVESVMDGSYQSSLNTWWENNFPGRGKLIKLRGSAIYSLLDESPNDRVVKGADEYLFEYDYVSAELGYVDCNEDYYDELVGKLEKLDSELAGTGRELYVFISPNKVDFFKDKLPLRYRLIEKDKATMYDELIDALAKSDVHYFDCHKVLMENVIKTEEHMAPVFYRTGTHWTPCYGLNCAAMFAQYVNANSAFDLGDYAVEEVLAEEPVWPDADLFQSLNILQPYPESQYHGAVMSLTREGDHPGVFIRGGSFMGQSLSGLINRGNFSSDIHFENNNIFSENYSKVVTLDSFTDYDKVDMQGMLADKDIIILEVNEAAIQNMSFGFIDYVLDNPEVLER